jgi:hypothetical protein
MIRTEVEIDYNSLPKRWEYVDCIPSKTVSGGIDLIADDQVLRIVFSTAQARLLAEERAIVRLLEPRRLLSRDISPAQRVRLITEGVGMEGNITYNIWTEVQKDKVTLVPREVQLSIWLPPVEEVADLAERWLEGGQKGKEKFSIGYAMSSFKSYLIKAGFEGGRFSGKNRSDDIRGKEAGIEEVRFSAKNRSNDIRGRFLKKYPWFEWCAIPAHLFSVCGFVEFEGGVLAGVSNASMTPLFRSHRIRLNDLGEETKQTDLTDVSQPNELDQSIKQLLDGQLRIENKFNPLAKHLDALLDFVKRRVKLQSSCKGGTVHGIKKKLELFANQIVKNATLPFLKKSRACLINVPDNLLLKMLLFRIVEIEEGDEYFRRKIKGKEISSETLRRWMKLLESCEYTNEYLTPLLEDLATKDVENYKVDYSEIERGFEIKSNPRLVR